MGASIVQPHITVLGMRDLELKLNLCLLQPLGMNASTFITEVDDWPRVVTAYQYDDAGALRELSKEVPL